MVSGHGEPNTPKISIPESQSYKMSVKRKFSDFVSKFFLEEEADNQGQQPMFMQSISSSVKMTITNKERLADNFNIIFSDWEGEDSNYIHGKYLEHHPRTIKFRSMEVEQGSPFKLPRLKTAHSKTRYVPGTYFFRHVVVFSSLIELSTEYFCGTRTENLIVFTIIN